MAYQDQFHVTTLLQPKDKNMLCTINTEVGGVATDAKSRFFNAMSSIVAIATASAGSTPSNKPVNSSGTRNNSYECITVISNTEAGGWSTGTSNFYGPAATFNASAAAQFIDLYHTSGKSTYPYYRIVLGLYNNTFAGNFSSYFKPEYACGHTALDPSTTAWTSAESAFTTSIINKSWPQTSFSVGDTDGYTSTAFAMRFDTTGKTYTVASTANYLIMTDGTWLWYFGIRTQAAFELARTDNPPWVHFYYSREAANGPVIGGNSHTERVAAWSATINASGTVLAPSLYGQYTTNQGAACAITGMINGTPQYNANIGSFANYWHTTTVYKAIRTPIFGTQLNSNYGSYTGSSYYLCADGPVTDPTTGLSVPPVFPVVINCNEYNSLYYSTGVCPGIYKGMHGSASYVNYFNTASSYTIGADTYYPVKAGHPTYYDLWMFRQA